MANAPGILITVAFGVAVLMFASSVCLGKVESQLPLKNQSEETSPFQFLVWACVETVDAAKSAIAASNPDNTDLQPLRWHDAAPCCDPMKKGRCGARLIPAPNPSAMPIMKMGRYSSGFTEMRKRKILSSKLRLQLS